MKTPDEIKKGLECCVEKNGCQHCPYNDDPEECMGNYLEKDALNYINHLEEQLQYTVDAADIMKDEALKLEQRLAQAERERDACIKDLDEALNRDGLNDCYFCKQKFEKCPECKWEWRGVCEENGKEERQ